MSERIIADLPRNGRERVCIMVREYRGSRFCDLRTFATNAEGAIVPTPKGLSLRADMIRPAIAALEEAERELASSPAEKRSC